MTVVLGYDESPGARQALTVALDIAQKYGDPIVLVYATQPPGASLGEEYRSHLAALEEIGRTAVEHGLAEAAAAGVEATVELVAEKPAQALLDVADRHDARVIVVGTWGEGPIRGAILGSVPYKLLHLSRRPVLCVPVAD